MKNAIFVLAMLLLTHAPLFGQRNYHHDKDYNISPVGMLDLSTSDAKVFITGTNRTNAHVKIDRTVTAKGWLFEEEHFNVDISEENGNLYVHEKYTGTRGGIGYYNEDYRIDIELPQGAGLKVRGDDGDYYIKNINGAISLSLDDADAELAQCKGNKFDFRLDDGDIRMDEGRGTLDITGDDADIEIYKAAFTAINANIDDGDLIIETSLADAGNYVLKSQDGLISLHITGGGGNFDIRHDDGAVITEGSFKVVEKRDDETRLALANGSAKVSVHADDARVRLRAE